jgi:hypothetical protein
MWARVILGSGLFSVLACTASHERAALDAFIPEPPPPVGSTGSALVGPAGGRVTLGALVLDVPAGALDRETEIRVEVVADSVPSAFTAFSPMYRFSPAGLRFARPVRVRIPFGGNASLATIFWSRADGDELVPRATTVDGDHAETQITHFSRAFVGTACEGADCCDRANGELDVLLMVDDSGSMGEEQASLVRELPRIAEVLATGDLDGDGMQDFPAVASLHLGVVSSDMGTAGFRIPTCDGPSGDDGILRTAGNTTLAGCGELYPSFATYDADDPSADGRAFASDVGCVAVLGVSGCGFEQQLEASLKAITPSTSAIRFEGGSVGHADGANDGFLRDGSVLAVLSITDENDCSAADAELFDPTSSTYTEDLNLRCFLHPGALHPASRYADGLLATRRAPADLVFGLIAGIPEDLASATPDYDAILRDPRMVERIDPAMPTRLAPSCDEEGRGVAFPPTRLVEVARQIDAAGGAAVIQSICQGDFTPAVSAILTRVSARVAGRCGP